MNNCASRASQRRAGERIWERHTGGRRSALLRRCAEKERRASLTRNLAALTHFAPQNALDML
jgi:hypothetical protein